jgi:hypothetical protein
MDIVISLVERDGGAWSICRDSVALYDQLRLGPAIKLARQLARDEHRRLGHNVSVLLTGFQEAIQLAHYTAQSAAA